MVHFSKRSTNMGLLILLSWPKRNKLRRYKRSGKRKQLEPLCLRRCFPHKQMADLPCSSTIFLWHQLQKNSFIYTSLAIITYQDIKATLPLCAASLNSHSLV